MSIDRAAVFIWVGASSRWEANDRFWRKADIRTWADAAFPASSSALLMSGNFMLKYGVIGPIGMRNVWKCAERFELWAERIGHLCR
jgi:hypothetical protein